MTMSLTFLCLAFVRIRELLRFQRRDAADRAIEIVALRNKVVVLSPEPRAVPRVIKPKRSPPSGVP